MHECIFYSLLHVTYQPFVLSILGIKLETLQLVMSILSGIFGPLTGLFSKF